MNTQRLLETRGFEGKTSENLMLDDLNEKALDNLQNYTAIDFETANPKRWSICQIGLVRVENGIIVKRIKLLVKPPDNFYWARFTTIHGISSSKTLNSPTFDKVWQFIEPMITGQNVVAHNGFGFDFQCLKQTLEYYGITPPDFKRFCTYKIYGSNLSALCRQYNISFQHHDPLSDAMACARLFMLHQRGIA
jgi:DNA polymerase III subunit epsilon